MWIPVRMSSAACVLMVLWRLMTACPVRSAPATVNVVSSTLTPRLPFATTSNVQITITGQTQAPALVSNDVFKLNIIFHNVGYDVKYSIAEQQFSCCHVY